jgi:hypothetical protein
MKIRDLRLCGIRCFEDTGDISFDPKCNIFIFVGKNNSGKSTVIKSILGWQGFPFDNFDVRPSQNDGPSYVTTRIYELSGAHMSLGWDRSLDSIRISKALRGAAHQYSDTVTYNIPASQSVFPTSRPAHSIVPFIARRKATQFIHDVCTNAQLNVSWTLSALYSRIDLLASYGHPRHNKFLEAVKDVIGLPRGLSR